MLIKGIDDDAISYECVVDAFKSKEEERIQKALLTSALVAFDMQEASKKALTNVKMLIELGNKNLYSDLISSAILLACCNEMASLNVVANASMIKDEKIKGKVMVVCSDEVAKVKIKKEIPSNSFVPATAGLLCASFVINDIVGELNV